MQVDPEDGECRECGGRLTITDSDDATMTVLCDECGDGYDVETDAFGDGCMKYFVPLQVRKRLGEEEDDVSDRHHE